MKKFNIIILTLLICIFSQIGVFAFGNSNSDDDIIIPSAGVTLDKDGKPDAWISVPKSLRSKGTPVQDENDHIYVEPKNRQKPIKEIFKRPEGFNFQLQQPSIKVGG